MIRIKELHAKWMKDADYRREYDTAKDEFANATVLIEKRTGPSVVGIEIEKPTSVKRG